jgi:hypothetical protein
LAAKLPPPGKDGRLRGENADGSDGRTARRAKPTAKRAEVARVKAEILSLYEAGHSAEDACRMAGKQFPIWAYYKRTDSDFKQSVDLIQARRAGARTGGANRDITFEEFSEKYLNSKLFTHQLQWIDVIEGRAPRDLHPQVYHPGDPDAVIINTPPGHAKSTTITMNYVTYKIVTNPGVPGRHHLQDRDDGQEVPGGHQAPADLRRVRPAPDRLRPGQRLPRLG